MATIIINTYDPAGCFDMDEETAAAFFDFVEARAIAQGYDVKRVWVDAIENESHENSKFIEDCFQDF